MCPLFSFFSLLLRRMVRCMILLRMMKSWKRCWETNRQTENRRCVSCPCGPGLRSVKLCGDAFSSKAEEVLGFPPHIVAGLLLFANRPAAEEAVFLVLNWSTEFSSRIAQFGCRLLVYRNNQALTAEEMGQRLKVLVVGCSSGVGFQVTPFSPQSFVSFVIHTCQRRFNSNFQFQAILALTFCRRFAVDLELYSCHLCNSCRI